MIPAALEKQIREEVSNEMPVRLEGWCDAEKALVLAELVLSRQPHLIVESGVFGGRSLFVMALAQKLTGKGITVGIDPWTTTAALEGGIDPEQEKWWTQNVKLEEIYAGFVKSAIRLDLLPTCRWIRDKSENAAKVFKDGSIDIFHQDSNHTEMISCLEVITWQSKIAANGLWIMDDSNWKTQEKALTMIEGHGFRPIITQPTFMVFERK